MKRVVTIVAVAAPALAFAHHCEEEFTPPPPFGLELPSLGGSSPARAVAPYQTSSRIAAAGAGALAIDADSGELLRTDAAGELVDHIPIGRDAGLLAYDPVAQRAYVADRRGDRIVVVDTAKALAIVASWHTPAEPYGIALAPDRETALVTTIADRTLVAFDSGTGRERWRAPLGAEPRGIAIAADGRRATVASLATGGLDEIEFDRDRAHVTRVALAVPIEAAHARGAFAVTYLGDRFAVSPYQLEVPAAIVHRDEGHYGGGDSSQPPITHHVAFIARDGRQATAASSVQEPRAVAWDPARDELYVAGMASDTVVSVLKASQVDVTAGAPIALGKRCGADGLAIASDGDVLVWCALSRDVARISHEGSRVRHGPELVASSLDAEQHRGLVLFHTGDANISAFGALSCGNCHLDGRADGLSWRIHDQMLQTPLLAGRLADTAPFKWDGTAPDLPSSLQQTIERLGGAGLAKRRVAALAAYLTAMPPVRAPTRDPQAIARGEELFESAKLGCTQCHDGPAYTDRERHQLPHQADVDTPSLRGLAASAPYFHDGSAPTLEAVVRDRGRIHGMADGAAGLTDAELRDLVAFLETR